MATFTIDSTKVGTAVKTGAGTMTGLTIAQPSAGALTDVTTPITLLDASAATIGKGYSPTLFSAPVVALSSLYAVKPGTTESPGLSPPTWPQSVGNLSAGYVNGVYVASCPVGVSLTLTA